MAKVLVAGIAVADFVFDVGEMPREPVKYRALDATITGGGCAANAAVAIVRDGGEAMLAARFGDDPVGRLILEGLEREGVDTSLCHISEGGHSSFSSIYVDATGERQIMNFQGRGLPADANWLRDVPDVDIILADNRWHPAAARAIELAQDAGLRCIIDGESPYEGDPFTGASHVAFSQRGLAAFAGEGMPEDRIAEAQEKLRNWVCVTDGARGTWHTRGDVVQHSPAFNVEAVDTLGAGDVWHGIFALQLARGATEEQAMIRASAAAAIKCTRFGGRDGTPTAAETDAFLKERGA